MARSRVTRPEFFTDQKLGSVSIQARYTFKGMWNVCDDYGVCPAHPTLLAASIFPYDKLKDKTISVWLEELEGIGVIVQFEHNGEGWYSLPKFMDHQKIHNPSKTRNPSPSEILGKNPRDSESLGKNTPLTESETESETETESDSLVETIPFDQIIEDLNEVTKKGFKTKSPVIRDLIRARWVEGWREKDFAHVHRVKALDWLNNPKYNRFLRPATLYQRSKFEGYRNEIPIPENLTAEEVQLARVMGLSLAELRGQGNGQTHIQPGNNDKAVGKLPETTD